MRSVGVVSLFTMLSRVLGAVRDIVMASFFGTSLAMSAFVIAFRIPNLFRRLFGEGALSAAFVPVFVESREKESDDRAWVMAAHMLNVLFFVLAIITIVLMLSISWVQNQFSLSVYAFEICNLMKIMLPYMVFICMVALCMGILNSFNRFALPAATPCLLNLCWIISILFLAPRFGDLPEERIYGVAWGILIAGVVQLSVQFPLLFKLGFKLQGSLGLKDPKVKKVMLLALPAALAAAVTQVNVLLDSIIAYAVGTHAPAALFYSERLIYLPLGIFATALGTVLLPAFSRQVAQGNPDEMKKTMAFALRNLLFIVTPAAFGLLFLSTPIIEMMHQRGEFSAQSTFYVSSALKFYSLGLIVFSLAKVFLPAFYGLQDTRTPMRLAVVAVGINLALNLLFVLTWPAEYKHAGLACATVLAELVYVGALVYCFKKKMGLPPLGPIVHSFVRFVFASVLMGWAAWVLQSVLNAQLAEVLPLEARRIVSVFSGIGVGVLLYVGLCFAFKAKEPVELLSAIKSRRKA